MNKLTLVLLLSIMIIGTMGCDKKDKQNISVVSSNNNHISSSGVNHGGAGVRH